MYVSPINILTYNDLNSENNQQEKINIANINQIRKKAKNAKKHLPCPIGNCPKNFSKPCLLKNHMLGHKNEQKYCCNTCDKSFNTTTLLNAHKKTHNPKKHTCDSCNKSFVRNINLKIHNTTKSHIDKISGYKKYKCTICIQGFNSYNKLGDHYIKEHKLSKPFQCTLCNKKYVFKGNMVKHYNKAHENQTETQKIKNDKRDISLPKLKKLKTHQQQDKGKIPDESLLTTSNLTVADNGNQSIYQDNNKYNSPKLSDNNMPNIELKTDNDIRFGTKQVVNGENYFSNLEEYFDEKDDLFDLEKYFDEQDDI